LPPGLEDAMSWSANAARIALPRGKVFFARKTISTGVLDPFIFLGNASKLEFGTIGDDIAEVVDFTSYTPTPLTRISKKRVPEFPVSLMECNPDNLALVFMGEKPSEYIQTGGSITAEAISGVARVGGIYKLANKGTAAVDISAFTLKKVGGTPSFTNTTEVVLRDAKAGIFEIIALHSGVVDGDGLIADYTAPAISAGSGYKVILGGGVARIEGALLYIGTGSVGPRHQLDIWNCSIESDGAFPFIAEEPVNFGLKVNVLTEANHADLFRVTELATVA
jgi:hypothetical protein